MAARNKGTHFVITANRTDDGAAVYLRSDRTWSEDVREAEVLTDEATQDERLAYALKQERIVCDPYVFSVNVEGDRPVLLTTRESIRNDGPTVGFRRPDRDTKR